MELDYHLSALPSPSGSPTTKRATIRRKDCPPVLQDYSSHDLEPIMLDTQFCALNEGESDWFSTETEERPPSNTTGRQKMHSFPPSLARDWKHVIYNLLVENFNSEDHDTLVQPFEIEIDGKLRKGFKFNEKHNPSKKLAELYTWHVKHARLDLEDSTSVFTQDLYKYYLRSAFQLLAQYFEKYDSFSYLYIDEPLFVPGEKLEQATQRIKRMGTRTRKKMKMASFSS